MEFKIRTNEFTGLCYLLSSGCELKLRLIIEFGHTINHLLIKKYLMTTGAYPAHFLPASFLKSSAVGYVIILACFMSSSSC